MMERANTRETKSSQFSVTFGLAMLALFLPFSSFFVHIVSCRHSAQRLAFPLCALFAVYLALLFAASLRLGDYFQFEREAFFVCDLDSTKDKLVFNRTVNLKEGGKAAGKAKPNKK